MALHMEDNQIRHLNNAIYQDKLQRGLGARWIKQNRKSYRRKWKRIIYNLESKSPSHTRWKLRNYKEKERELDYM